MKKQKTLQKLLEDVEKENPDFIKPMPDSFFDRIRKNSFSVPPIKEEKEELK